jgi:hypothetical protein
MVKEIKKKKKKEGTGKYITTHTELKEFTKQVDSEQFTDKKFEKAYEMFKKPAYQQKGNHENR